MHSCSLPNLNNVSDQVLINNSGRNNQSSSAGYYLYEKTISDGMFGKTYLGLHRLTMQYVTVKIINKHRFKKVTDYKLLCLEIELLKNVHHENIVRLLEHVENQKQIVLIKEYCPNGNLKEYLDKMGKMPTNQIAQTLWTLVRCLDYVHANGYYHGSIRPENILLGTEGQIKLIGFHCLYLLPNYRQLMAIEKEYAYDFSSEHYLKIVNYLPPEVITDNDKSNNVNNDNKSPIDKQGVNLAAIDVWSCGVLLYQLCTGTLPFADPSLARALKNIQTGIFSTENILDNGVLGLIKQMLKINPMERISMRQILHHRWLKPRQQQSNDLPSVQPFVFDVYNLIQNQLTKENSTMINCHNSMIPTVLDNDVLNICLKIHSNEVNDIIKLRHNILHKFGHQTATYWLIKNNASNIHYFYDTDWKQALKVKKQRITTTVPSTKNDNSERDAASSDYSSDVNNNRKLMYKSSPTIELSLNVDGHVANDYFQNNNSMVDETDIPGKIVQCEKRNIPSTASSGIDDCNISATQNQSFSISSSASISSIDFNIENCINNAKNLLDKDESGDSDGSRFMEPIKINKVNKCGCNQNWLVNPNKNPNHKTKTKSSLPRKLSFIGLSKRMWTNNISRISSLLNFQHNPDRIYLNSNYNCNDNNKQSIGSGHSQFKNNTIEQNYQHEHRNLFRSPKGSYSCYNSPSKTKISIDTGNKTIDDIYFQLNESDQTRKIKRPEFKLVANLNRTNCICNQINKKANFNEEQMEILKEFESIKMNKNSDENDDAEWKYRSGNETSNGNDSDWHNWLSLNAPKKKPVKTVAPIRTEQLSGSSALIITCYHTYSDCIYAIGKLFQRKNINFYQKRDNRLRCCVSMANKVTMTFQLDLFKMSNKTFVMIKAKRLLGDKNDFQIIYNHLTKYLQRLH